MDAEIIRRHNEIVESKDVVIHAGDFTLSKKPFAENYIKIREIMQNRPDNPNFVGNKDVWLIPLQQKYVTSPKSCLIIFDFMAYRSITFNSPIVNSCQNRQFQIHIIMKSIIISNKSNLSSNKDTMSNLDQWLIG